MIYRAERQLSVIDCALLLPVPHISLILLLFACSFVSVVLCNIFYIHITLNILITAAHIRPHWFAVGMRHPRDGNGS